MWNGQHITNLKYKGDYIFYIAFEDGVAADVDFSDDVGCGPVFMPLQDHHFFKQAKIDGGTIAWPNGADIAPETLYVKTAAAAQGTPISSEEAIARLEGAG